ncbi:MAG TPA: SusD/RagB family nutrient-binding outer membrane lipoprotein, partial [Chitinophagaceae bacterium]|nr:SusD/RagB family nutrient-binding outer membrane lipoprotein [Chitinophagaceae bacterium]
ELAANGSTAENAATLYNDAVTASLNYYGEIATAGKLLDYYAESGGAQVAAPTAGEIAAYLAQPEVAYDAAKGLDQIRSQAYLNFFKESNEAWALIKRTGMPSNSTTLKLENLYYNGTLLTIPHRAPRTLPNTGDLNYTNANAAFEEMQADPNYGNGPSDISGRVWWDVN